LSDRYEASVVATATAATDSPLASIHTSTIEIRIQEIWVASLNSGSGFGPYAFYRPANTPVALTSVSGQANDPQDGSSTAQVDTAWTTAPTRGAVIPLRRANIDSVNQFAHHVYSWTDQGGLVIPVGGWIVFWNHSTGITPPNFIMNVAWDE
jgi:hypothetical protein